jgi:hypothetical protein
MGKKTSGNSELTGQVEIGAEAPDGEDAGHHGGGLE